MYAYKDEISRKRQVLKNRKSYPSIKCIISDLKLKPVKVKEFDSKYIKDGEKVVTDSIGSETEIRQQLNKEGKVVLSIKKSSTLMMSTIKVSEMVAVFTAIADLLDAGVNVSAALNAIIQSLDRNSRLTSILIQVRSALITGRSISQSFREFEGVFGATICAMIDAGEESGKLAETMNTAAEHIRNMAEIKSEMFKNLTYPATVFTVGIGGVTGASGIEVLSTKAD